MAAARCWLQDELLAADLGSALTQMHLAGRWAGAGRWVCAPAGRRRSLLDLYRC